MTYQPSKYSLLKAQLESLRVQLLSNLKPEQKNNLKPLIQLHLQVQEFFQTQILDSNSEAIAQGNTSSASEASILAYYVEINKQLRLLESDLVLLQAARNPATFEQRTKQASDRLNMLVGYCDALLTIAN